MASTSYSSARPPVLALGARRATRAACRATGNGHSQEPGLLGASEAGRLPAGLQEVKAQAQLADGTDGGVTRRRGPGRPPGIPAWNKGVPCSEAARKQISNKLKQKWKDPEFRSTVQEAMRGKEAWNKGRPHDEETRLKMSQAKQGSRHVKTTRKLMSEAKVGRERSAEIRAAVSERFRGVPKSPEQRAKMAATQRRRYAATRVLRAVEAVYQQTSAQAAAASNNPGSSGMIGGGGSGGGSAGGAGSMGSLPAGSSGGMAGSGSGPAGVVGGGMAGGPGMSGGGGGGANLGALRATSYNTGLSGLSASSGKRLSRTQILNTFKSELREYRALQEELSAWTGAFREKYNRKPNLVDVQRTGIPWLIERFKQYVLLRGRLFSDTSVLRGKLSEAIPDLESVRNANGSGGAAARMNANGDPGANRAVANRFAAVMDYKNQRQAGQARPAPAAGAGQGGPQTAEQQQEEAAAAAEQQAASRMMGSQVPPRVKLAMQAAMEYRQKKAHETKSAAESAAAVARAAGPAIPDAPQLSSSGSRGSGASPAGLRRGGALPGRSSSSGAAAAGAGISRSVGGDASKAAIMAASLSSSPFRPGLAAQQAAAGRAAAEHARVQAEAAEAEAARALPAAVASAAVITPSPTESEVQAAAAAAAAAALT